MVGWLATQYQRLAAKAERDGQYAAACGCLNSLRAMLVQPQLDAQFAVHFRGRFRTRGTAVNNVHKLYQRYQRAKAIPTLLMRGKCHA